MNSRQIKIRRREMSKENKKWPDTPIEIPKDQWPNTPSSVKRLAVYRSKYWLIQVFNDSGFTRLSVNRTTMKPDGMWDENISWDDLQQIKSQIGYASKWAVEVFPPENNIVNVANMRHLWILNEKPNFGWQ